MKKEKRKRKGFGRFAALVLALSVFLECPISTGAAAKIISDEEERRALPIVSNETEGWPQGPVVSAQSAVVMEASTGTVLYEKNAHDPLYPASITKIMTTLVALEHSSMDETVTFSYDSVFSLDTGSSIIGGVNPGDTMSMKDVLYGIMICSGNEAAYAAAEHVAGTVSDFVDMMNARAEEIGCTDTNFCNPHGLPNENHVTSAMDMALITGTALNNASFKTIATTRRYTFPPTSSGEERIRLNHHLMMEGMEYAYEGCLGGKTGYTSAAGSTLVTFAERDDMLLICVVMNEKAPAQYLDTATLLDYGFANFRKVDMSGYGQNGSSEEDGFFLARVNSDAADGGLSVKQTGSAVLPVSASTDDIRGEVSRELEDGTITSVFYFQDMRVGSSVMQIQAQEDGRSSGRLFGTPQEQEETVYDIFHPEDVNYIYLNLKVIASVAAVVGIVIGLICLYRKTGNRRRRRRKPLVVEHRNIRRRY